VSWGLVQPQGRTGQDRARWAMARFNGELLRATRLDLGLSQEEAARALGIDVRTYRRYESGAVNEGGAFEVRTAARRKLLRRMCEELGVEDEATWLSEPSPAPARRGHTLLRARHFVGRQEELARLRAFCAQPGGGLMVVLAVGGAGKTALVERLAAEQDSVFVHSFYEDARTEPALEALSGEGARLVVLDGLEAVQSEGGEGRAFGELEDPALRRALREAASGSGRARVLLTTRLPVTDLAAWPELPVLSLPPLSDSESRRLLRAYGLRGDDAALSPLCARAGGHALSVAMYGSYVGTFLGGEPAHAERLVPEQAQADDPVARRLSAVLDAYGSALDERERQLLARLSLFAGPAEIPLLAALSRQPPEAVLQALARLERYGLVARTPAGVTAHPFVREHFRALLDTPREAHARLSEVLEQSLSGRPSARVSEPELLDRYELLLDQTLRAGRPLEAWGIYRRALGGFEHLGLRLGAMTRGARVLSRFAPGGDPAAVDTQLEGEARARLLYDWGLYALALGDLPRVWRCHEAYERALRGVHPEVALSMRAVGLRTRAYAAWLSGAFDQAREQLQASLALAERLQSASQQVRGLALLAMVEHDAGELDASDRLRAQAHRHEPLPTARRAMWEAEMLLARGRRGEARALLELAMDDCAQRGWAGHVAHGHTLLGLCALPEGVEVARGELERAWGWAMGSQEVEMILRCQELAVRVWAEGGEEGEAERERELGRQRVAGYGMWRFAAKFAG
jgi:transcriptional regulator with XRE-family HTH domain/tetratricopeptide (TPR) repeat protein